MTLILDLPPELEIELQEVAARRGQDAATFAVATLANTLRDISNAAMATTIGASGGAGGSTNGATTNGAATSTSSTDTTTLNGNSAPLLSSEELDAALDELAALGADIPPSDDPDIYSRANIYFDHD